MECILSGRMAVAIRKNPKKFAIKWLTLCFTSFESLFGIPENLSLIWPPMLFKKRISPIKNGII